MDQLFWLQVSMPKLPVLDVPDIADAWMTELTHHQITHPQQHSHWFPPRDSPQKLSLHKLSRAGVFTISELLSLFPYTTEDAGVGITEILQY